MQAEDQDRTNSVLIRVWDRHLHNVAWHVACVAYPLDMLYCGHYARGMSME